MLFDLDKARRHFDHDVRFDTTGTKNIRQLINFIYNELDDAEGAAYKAKVLCKQEGLEKTSSALEDLERKIKAVEKAYAGVKSQFDNEMLGR